MVFGACLESFQYDVDAGEWVIRLEPKSRVSIPYRKALGDAGMAQRSVLPDEAPPEGEAL